MSPVTQKMVVAGGLVLLLLTASATWKVQDWRYGKKLAGNALLHQADLTTISIEASIQVRQAMDKQQAAEKMVADIDAKTTKEKTNDLAENERLRSVVAAGERRLRIAGSCSAGGSSMPGTAVGASMGNAGTVELTGEV